MYVDPVGAFARLGDTLLPEAHALVERRIQVDAFNRDADGACACQSTEVVVRSVPRSQETDLEVLRLLLLRPRCCHDDRRQDNNSG